MENLKFFTELTKEEQSNIEAGFNLLEWAAYAIGYGHACADRVSAGYQAHVQKYGMIK